MRTRNSYNIWYGHINTFLQTQTTVLLCSSEGGLYELLCLDLDVLTTCRLFICITIVIGTAMLTKYFASHSHHVCLMYL